MSECWLCLQLNGSSRTLEDAKVLIKKINLGNTRQEQAKGT